MNKQEIINTGLIEQYVLGLTDLKETQLVEQLAAQDKEIQQYINELRSGLDKYATAYAIDPPADLKQKVLKHIETIDPPPPANWNTATAPASPVWPWLSLAAAVALVFSTFWFFQENRNSQQELASIQQDFDAFKTACESQQLDQEQLQKNYALLKDENTRHIHLRGSALAPKSLVVVYWNPAQKAALLNSVDLPPPPEGKTYQLWADIEGEMVDMGVLKHAPGTPLEIPFMVAAESLNITLEDAGGAKHPTVSRLYVNGKV